MLHCLRITNTEKKSRRLYLTNLFYNKNKFFYDNKFHA